MSVKDNTAGEYIKTGKTKADNRGVALKLAEQVGTGRLIWIIIKRHKVSLLMIGNIILVLNYAIPEWPNIVRSLIN